MKLKILTLLSVFAVALGVRAAQEPLSNRIGFENFDEGYKIDVTCDDGGQGSDVRFWQSPNNNQTAIVGRYLGTGDSYVYKAGEPKLVDDGPGNRYLTVESSVNSIYRTSVSNIGFLPSYASSPKIGDGIFIDTLMEFSAIDGLEVPVDMGRAKIMVWLGTDGGADTNLYVTAGSIGASDRAITPTNFKLDVDIEPDSWHRLTVRAIDNIITDEPAVVGFEVFIDAQSVACAEASALAYETAFGGYLDGRLNATAKDLYAQKRLFPSLIAAGTDDANVIAAAGFNGVGKIDDLSIVDYASAPAFAQGGMWTLKWTEGVTGFKLNGEAVSIEGGAGAKEIAFTGASDTAEITEVTYDEAVYEAGTWTAEGGATLDNDTFTITAANAVCTIVVNPKAATRFTVGGKSYSLLSEVFADPDLGGDPITIELTDDFSTALETDMEEGYLIGGEMPAITLDLKGRTITKEGISGVLFTINEECKGFTLIDTAGGGKLVGDAEGLFNISGAMTIGKLEDDNGVTIETVLTDKFGASEGLTIVNGSFKDSDNTTDGAFSYVGNLAKGRGCELVNGYWMIKEGGAYKLKWTEGVASFKANGTPMEVTEAGGVTLCFVGESTTLEITEVVYAENYRQGAWIAEGGATLSETTFTIISGAEDPVCTIVAEAIPPPPASVNFTASFGEGVVSAKLMKGDELVKELVAGDPVEVEFETTYTIEPTLKPWYVDATISTSEGITLDGLSFTVDAGAEAASATISATNAKDSARSASEIADALGITDNPEAIANDTRFKAIATWAQGKEYLPEKLNDPGFNREYLLNDFTGDLKITSIAVDSTTGVITIGKPEWKFNGALHVQGKVALADEKWSDCSEPIKTENGYNFFRLELRFE